MRDKYLFRPAVIPPESQYVEHRSRQQDVVELFTGIKESRKLLADTLHAEVEPRLEAARKNPSEVGEMHQQLHRYEQAYLHIGGDWSRFVGALKLRYPTTVALKERSAGTYDLFGTSQQSGSARGPVLLGTVFVNDARFELLPAQPGGVLHPVYQRIGQPGRHYVKLSSSDTFVRRFVFRGLNAGDIMALADMKPLAAAWGTDAINRPEQSMKHHPGTRFDYPNRHVLTVEEQILSHTRGWTKRFVSAAASFKRPAYSTRGTVFVSIYGTSYIDLARVPNDRIYDVHRPDTAAKWLGRDTGDLTTRGAGYPATKLDEEKHLAFRDTIRTRELLVKGEIPFAAVKAAAGAETILAICYIDPKDHSKPDALRLGPLAKVSSDIVDEDQLAFQVNSRRWHLFSFKSASACDAAYKALGGIPEGTATTCSGKNRRVKLKLKKFEAVTPDAGAD